MATAAELVDQLQTDVSKALSALDNVYPFVRALVNSHQEPYVSYLLPEQLDDQNRAYRSDKYARALAASAGQGLAMNSSETPGNLPAISAEAELMATLHASIKTLRSQLWRAHGQETTRYYPDNRAPLRIRHGACTLVRVGPKCRTCTALDLITPPEPSFEQMLWIARSLSWDVTTTTTLHRVLRDLEAAHKTATDLVDGNARVLLADTYPGIVCPHCNRATLAAFFRDDVIRCDRDPDTGQWETCICTDPFCECKNRPVEFRHDWVRTKPSRDKRSWYALADTFDNADLKARLA